MNNLLTTTVNVNRKWKLPAYLFYPTGVIRIWKSKRKWWLRLLYTIVGLPLFLAVTLFFGVTGFALFLPPLDMTVGNRPDRIVYFSEGNYKSTFLKTGAETNGAYELLQIEVAPHGGNDWHYHKNFEEHFTVLKGTAKVGKNKQEYLVKQGDSAVDLKGDMHYFANPTDSTLLLLVRVVPSRGLEKSIRVIYGLSNDG